MQNISLQSSGMHRKQNFEFLGLKVTQQSWLLLFAFSPPLVFCFSCLIFFLLLGKAFRKAFRILGLGERKGRSAMEQDFHGDFQVNVTWFLASFSAVPWRDVDLCGRLQAVQGKWVKTESVGKLSNINFQWTKPLYQNNQNHIAFLFTFFKGYRYTIKIISYISNNTKRQFLTSAPENKFQISLELWKNR